MGLYMPIEGAALTGKRALHADKSIVRQRGLNGSINGLSTEEKSLAAQRIYNQISHTHPTKRAKNVKILRSFVFKAIMLAFAFDRLNLSHLANQNSAFPTVLG